MVSSYEAIPQIPISDRQREEHEQWHVSQELSVWGCPLCAQQRRADEAKEGMKEVVTGEVLVQRRDVASVEACHPKHLMRKILVFKCSKCRELPGWMAKWKHRVS